MSLSVIEVFSSNPIPPDKTILKDFKANNLHPLRHSLQKKKKKSRNKMHSGDLLETDGLPLSLYLFFICHALVCLCFYSQKCRFFELTVIYFYMAEEKELTVTCASSVNQ